jgi:hypothetical protein
MRAIFATSAAPPGAIVPSQASAEALDEGHGPALSLADAFAFGA